MGLKFPNPLGLAAGFDKNAVAVRHWHKLGFGFVEVGTVTPVGQPGNDKPRLFRIPSEKALINRLGFNNAGAEAMRAQLRGYTSHAVPLGINLGKNKLTPDEKAAEDYLKSFQILEPFGDYYVVNVSSPNTPGLRALQDRGPLNEIFAALRAVGSSKPMLVKIAPDLSDESLREVVEVAVENKLAGIIATNTTIRRDVLRTDPGQIGGLSGRPVFDLSNHALRVIAEVAPPEMTLIGVGGVFTADDVRRKQELGAKLVQMYTGWIYGGPHTCAKILLDLLDK